MQTTILYLTKRLHSEDIILNFQQEHNEPENMPTPTDK